MGRQIRPPSVRAFTVILQEAFSLTKTKRDNSCRPPAGAAFTIAPPLSGFNVLLPAATYTQHDSDGQ